MKATLFPVLFEFFFILAVGWFLGKRRILKEAHRKSLSDLMLKVATPCMILMGSQNELEPESLHRIFVTFLFSVLSYIALLSLSALLVDRTKLDEPQKKVIPLMLSFGNVGFIGMPVIQAIFGNEGIICVVIQILVFNLIFFTLGTERVEKQKKLNFRSIFGNLNTVTSLIALLLYFLQIKFPSVLSDSLQTLGNMNLPLSLILMGIQLSGLDLRKILTVKSLWPVTLLRMFAVPLISLTVFRLLGTDEFLTGVNVVMSGMPIAALVSILAAEHKCAPDFAVEGTMQSMLVFLLSLPVLMMLI